MYHWVYILHISTNTMKRKNIFNTVYYIIKDINEKVNWIS